MTSSFYLFPRLPAELRLQIWEKAIFIFHENHSGLHYVTLDDNKRTAPLVCDWGHHGKPHSGKRSVYLWHGGLWMACKESRAVAMQVLNPQKWRDYHNEELDKTENLWLELTKSCEWRDTVIACSPGAGGDHQPCRLVVHPSQDLFCINAVDWKRLARQWDINHNFLGTSLPVKNICLQYDPSWREILKGHSYWTIQDDNSAVGFLVSWLCHKARDCAYEIYEGEKLYLIDETARWASPSPSEFETDHKYTEATFHDCDNQYVKFNLLGTGPGDPFQNIHGSTILEFLKDLDYPPIGLSYSLGELRATAQREWDDVSEDGYGGIDGSWFDSVKNLLGLIVRRDNQVTGELIRRWKLLED
ncbi:hypothetical protein G7046_g946 [Stylonectria norvegica]|nr:hypothetical protein G7046_g946 [Stylonectria norvegica]